jgi:hypothetical protein
MAKSKANYVPNKNIKSITIQRGKKTTEVKNKDILDGAYVKKGVKFKKGGSMSQAPTNKEVYDNGDVIDTMPSDIGGSNMSEDNIIEYNGKTYLVSTNLEENRVISPNRKATIYEEEYRTGGVAGSKHVDVTKGYRLPHGYKAVKGDDKNKNYSKGKPKVRVTPGWRLPKGYEVVEGAYNMKYENGGMVEGKISREFSNLQNGVKASYEKLFTEIVDSLESDFGVNREVAFKKVFNTKNWDKTRKFLNDGYAPNQVAQMFYKGEFGKMKYEDGGMMAKGGRIKNKEIYFPDLMGESLPSEIKSYYDKGNDSIVKRKIIDFAKKFNVKISNYEHLNDNGNIEFYCKGKESDLKSFYKEFFDIEENMDDYILNYEKVYGMPFFETDDYEDGGMTGNYEVKYWETEEDRDMGESYVYGQFASPDKAEDAATRLYNKMGYACVEVIKKDTDEVILHLSEDEYAKGGGVEMDNNTFVNILLNYGFVEKRSSYGVRYFYNKSKDFYAGLDEKQRKLDIYKADDMVVQGREYTGYSIQSVIDFLNKNGFESGHKYAKGGNVDYAWLIKYHEGKDQILSNEVVIVEESDETIALMKKAKMGQVITHNDADINGYAISYKKVPLPKGKKKDSFGGRYGYANGGNMNDCYCYEIGGL